MQLQSLKVLGKIVSKLDASKVASILPGVSSVAAKVLGGDIKSSDKIKREFVEIWVSNVIAKYLMTLRRQSDAVGKRSKLIDLKSMLAK